MSELPRKNPFKKELEKMKPQIQLVRCHMVPVREDKDKRGENRAPKRRPFDMHP